jgi:hypothetical protein
MHQRRIIRNAFADRILAAETGAQDRVFAARAKLRSTPKT